MTEFDSQTVPLWRTLVRRNDMGVSPEGMAIIMKTIADSIPCLRISNGIDFTSAGDVRRWLRAEAARATPPPGLKEVAINDLNDAYNADQIDDTTYENILRALESIDD